MFRISRVLSSRRIWSYFTTRWRSCDVTSPWKHSPLKNGPQRSALRHGSLSIHLFLRWEFHSYSYSYLQNIQRKISNHFMYKKHPQISDEFVSKTAGPKSSVLHSLKLTAKAPANGPSQKGNSSPTIDFQGLWLSVSGKLALAQNHPPLKNTSHLQIRSTDGSSLWTCLDFAQKRPRFFRKDGKKWEKYIPIYMYLTWIWRSYFVGKVWEFSGLYIYIYIIIWFLECNSCLAGDLPGKIPKSPRLKMTECMVPLHPWKLTAGA